MWGIRLQLTNSYEKTSDIRAKGCHVMLKWIMSHCNSVTKHVSFNKAISL